MTSAMGGVLLTIPLHAYNVQFNMMILRSKDRVKVHGPFFLRVSALFGSIVVLIGVREMILPVLKLKLTKHGSTPTV